MPPLSDIEWAAQDWAFWNEHWTNTVSTKRIVLLRRRSGLFKIGAHHDEQPVSKGIG